MKLIDTHAHLADEKTSLTDIFAGEVFKIISIGCNYQEIIQSFDLTKKYPNQIYSTAGVYPHDNKTENENKTDAELLEQVKGYSTKDAIVAIGECGFDFSTPPSWETTRSKDEQYELFYEQLLIAKAVNKPLIIHSRQAATDTIEFLTTNKKHINKAVWHCFTEDLTTAKKLLELDIKISITGIVTYKTGLFLHDIIKYVGIKNIMLETDAPYLTPEPLRSRGVKVSSPTYVKIVAETIAQVLNLPIAEVAEQTTQTAINFFNLT